MVDEPSLPGQPQFRFSLRTLFRIVTCAAITAAFLEFARKHFEPLAVLPAFGVFFISWYALRRRPDLAAIWFFVTIVLFIATPVSPIIHEGRRYDCENNRRQVGEAILYYEQKHHCLPPAYVADANGKALSSWRAIILSAIGRADLHDTFHFDEPWNSAANSAVANVQLRIYACPSDRFKLAAATTSYFAIVGPNTAWPGPAGRKLSEIKDSSKTILLIEAADSGINWAEPRDLTVSDVANGINPKNAFGPSSHHPDGINVLFADGHVEFLPENTDTKELAAMCDINGPGNSTAAGRQ